MQLTDEIVDACCKVMHEAYEEAAPNHGWFTQTQSRKPWDEVPEANKQTMRIAVRALVEFIDSHSTSEFMGLQFASMPTGVTPLSAVMCMKALNEDGKQAYYELFTGDINMVEALGMVISASDTIRKRLMRE